MSKRKLAVAGPSVSTSSGGGGEGSSLSTTTTNRTSSATKGGRRKPKLEKKKANKKKKKDGEPEESQPCWKCGGGVDPEPELCPRSGCGRYSCVDCGHIMSEESWGNQYCSWDCVRIWATENYIKERVQGKIKERVEAKTEKKKKQHLSAVGGGGEGGGHAPPLVEEKKNRGEERDDFP